MDNNTVYTNNSVIIEFFEHKGMTVDTKFFAAPAIEVLTSVKTAVNHGAVLLSNPLAGVRNTNPVFPSAKFSTSSRPNTQKVTAINPYISLLVSQANGTVDFQSARKLEEALTVYKKNARLRFMPHNDEAIKNFQLSDLELILFALSATSGV